MLSDKDFKRMVEAGVPQHVIKAKLNKGFTQFIHRFKGSNTGTRYKRKHLNTCKRMNLPNLPTRTPNNNIRTHFQRYY